MKERGDLIVENQQPNIKTREEACRWAVMRVRALIADWSTPPTPPQPSLKVGRRSAGRDFT